MHSLERKYNPANRSRFQHFLHGLLFHTGKYHKSAVIIDQKGDIRNTGIHMIYYNFSSSPPATSSGSCWTTTRSSTTSQSRPPSSPSTWTGHGSVIPHKRRLCVRFLPRSRTMNLQRGCEVHCRRVAVQGGESGHRRHFVDFDFPSCAVSPRCSAVSLLPEVHAEPQSKSTKGIH